jgi:putative transposase
MPRLPRLKPRNSDQSYHLYNRLAGEPGCYPLQQSGAREMFLEILLFYARFYFCRLVAYSIMGNHYHLVAQFEAFRVLTREQLRNIAKTLYAGRLYKPYLFWSSKQWGKFNRRLFDVSEFMRNVESDYARRHNRKFGRKGQLWADRFKSNLLTCPRAVQAVSLYVELNALRARLVRRPEDYRFASARLRLAGLKRPEYLLPLTSLWGCQDPVRATQMHFAYLQHRGGLRVENEDDLLRAIIRQDEADGYAAGVYLENQRYINDGLVLGEPAHVREVRATLVARRIYKQVRSPAATPSGSLATLRQPRNNFIAVNLSAR